MERLLYLTLVAVVLLLGLLPAGVDQLDDDGLPSLDLRPAADHLRDRHEQRRPRLAHGLQRGHRGTLRRRDGVSLMRGKLVGKAAGQNFPQTERLGGLHVEYTGIRITIRCSIYS